ncbi:translation initiation factor IF-3, partial [Acinetobacter sp. UBA6720]
MKQPDRNQQGGNKSNRPALNDEIRAKEVRLVDENGEQKGIVSLAEALRAAESVELDLVEIVANAEPPVCK